MLCRRIRPDVWKYHSMTMEDIIEQLTECVNQALDMVYDNDYHLISNRAINRVGIDEHHHVGERSIVFRFAHYLQNIIDDAGGFADYDLDCEYNRNGAVTKSLPSFPNGTYPDVILHQRGSNDGNMLVIEFKTYWNRSQKVDARKIKEFTSKSGKYGFVMGMTILLGKVREKATVKRYIDGHRM